MSNGDGGIGDYLGGDVANRVTAPRVRALDVPGGLSGGTLLEYGPPWTIVPQGAVPSTGQIAEPAFLKLLTTEIAIRMPNAPGHGDDRAILERCIEAMLRLGRERIIEGDLEPWLRERLRVPADRQLSVEGWIDRFFEVVDPESLVDQLDLYQRAVSVDEEEQRLRFVDDEDESEERIQAMSASIGSKLGAAAGPLAGDIAACLALVETCLVMARVAGPKEAIKPTGIQGQLVHLMIQEHYLLTHPGNRVMMESFVHWPGFRGSILDLPGGGASPLWSALRFALGTVKELTKLPDILDIDEGEVYDIKPRGQMRSGRRKVCAVYVAPYNFVARPLGLRPLAPGFRWHPSPAYWLPPDKIALTFQCPGLIVYDLFTLVPPRLRPQEVRLPVLNNRRSKELSTEVKVAIVVALIILVILLLASSGALSPIAAFFAQLMLTTALAAA